MRPRQPDTLLRMSLLRRTPKTPTPDGGALDADASASAVPPGETLVAESETERFAPLSAEAEGEPDPAPRARRHDPRGPSEPPQAYVVAPWLIRGVALAAVAVLVRVLLAQSISDDPENSGIMRWISIGAVAVVSLIWAGVDGIADGRRFDDPEDGPDLMGRWFRASIFAGIVAGVVSWAIGKWMISTMGEQPLLFEAFIGASFTALLVLIAAAVGSPVGRRFGSRSNG